MKIFSAVRGLEVLSKPIFFEATFAHPKFYAEKHGLPIGRALHRYRRDRKSVV